MGAAAGTWGTPGTWAEWLPVPNWAPVFSSGRGQRRGPCGTGASGRVKDKAPASCTSSEGHRGERRLPGGRVQWAGGPEGLSSLASPAPAPYFLAHKTLFLSSTLHRRAGLPGERPPLRRDSQGALPHASMAPPSQPGSPQPQEPMNKGCQPRESGKERGWCSGCLSMQEKGQEPTSGKDPTEGPQGRGSWTNSP